MKIKLADGTVIDVEDDHELQEGEELVGDSEEEEDDKLEVDTNEDESKDEDDEDESEVDDEKSKKPDSNDDEESEDDDEDEDEVIVTIGDEEAPTPEEDDSKAPAWVRELRKTHRETVRENRELKQKIEAYENPKPNVQDLGPKPKLEDFDYDTDQFEAELTKWHDNKRKADQAIAEAEAIEEEQKKAWQAELNTYGDQKSKLKVKDFDDAEASVLETFNQTQQGIIVQGAENKALVIYALGKNEEKAKELSQINDPVKFAFAVSKLEAQLKVKNRKKAPPAPEKKISGTGPKSGVTDSTLERLREKAEKTGNYTEVIAYKRQKRQAEKRA
jgi:hypothetical protein